MRVIWSIAALAAAALAAPHLNKRDYVVVIETETDVVYVTDIVTVTAQYEAPAQSTISTTIETMMPSVYNHNIGPPSAPGWEPPFSKHTPSAIPVPPSYTVMSSPTSTSYPVTPPPYTPTSSSTSTSTAATSVTSAAPPPPPPPNTSSSTSAVAPTSSEAPPSIAPTGYVDLVVAHHNLHRRNHSAPDMQWDDGLAKAAGTIASSCSYGHNTEVDKDTIGGYGQNIAAGVAADNVTVIITELFYNNEVNYYNGLYGQAQPDMSNFESWGHFSQIVWHDTTKVGCATQQCAKLANVASNVPPFFTVCNYQTPGNVAGHYTEVGNSLHLPTVHWNYYS